MSSKAERKLKELESRSEVVETSVGPIEYAVAGHGPPILAIHGGPGGFDQSLGVYDMFVDAGFQIICPSRPGYLRTPITVRRTQESQIRTMASLLDQIGVEKVSVVGGSAGGPPTYEFARLFPERTASRVTIDTLCKTYDIPDQADKIRQTIYLSDTGMALTLQMTRHMPHSAVKGIIATEGFLDKEQVKEKISRIIGGGRNVRWCYGLFQSLYPYSARKNGVENELKQEWNMDRFPRSDQGAGTHHTR